jgi:NAD-dependent DNA ligase
VPETRLRIAKWQVVQQERLIKDQRILIDRLRACGMPTDSAEHFLRQMYDVLDFRQQALESAQLSVDGQRVH